MLWGEEGVLVAPVAKKKKFCVKSFHHSKKIFFLGRRKIRNDVYKEKAIKIDVAFVNVFVVRESL